MSGEPIAFPPGAAGWTLTGTTSRTLKVEAWSQQAKPYPYSQGQGGATPQEPDLLTGLWINDDQNIYVPLEASDQTQSESCSPGQGADCVELSASGLQVPSWINYVQTIYVLALGIIVPAAVVGNHRSCGRVPNSPGAHVWGLHQTRLINCQSRVSNRHGSPSPMKR